MCAAVIKDGKGLEEQDDNSGLANQHAYGLIAVKKVNVSGKDVTLVQLRNPWGNYEPPAERDWSDESALWTDELKG